MKAKAIILSLALITFCAADASAHPAQAVVPSFDTRTETLTVKIAHSTTRPDTHYIYRVEIDVNGKKIIDDDTLGGQTSSAGRTYTTRLRGVQAGDTIKVTAFCNRGGAKAATIVVPGEVVSSYKPMPMKSETPIKQKKIKKEKKSRWGF